MTRSHRNDSRTKPAKPYKDFPLFAHNCGQWAKKIRGKLWYFGTWAAPSSALDLYKKQVDAIQAGRNPRLYPDDRAEGCTLKDVANSFLTIKQIKRNAGELSPRTFNDYHGACKRLVEFFGKDVVATTLNANDFIRYRAAFPKSWKLVRTGNEIRMVRTIFKFAYEDGLIEVPVRMGQAFSPPKRAAHRKAKQAAQKKHGKLMFTAAECRHMISKGQFLSAQ